MTHETFRELLPLYAVGALDGGELREFEQYVAASRERCEPEMKEYLAVANHLALAAPPVEPSPAVFEKVLGAIDQETTNALPAPAPKPPERERLGLGALLFRWVPWAATVVLAAALALVSIQLRTVSERYEQEKETFAMRIREFKNLSTDAVAIQKEFTSKYDQLVTELSTKNRQLEEEKTQLIGATEQLRVRLDNQSLKFVQLERRVTEQDKFLQLLKDDPNIRIAELADPEGKSRATAKVYWHSLTRNGLVVVSGLDSVPKGKGKSLELWTFCGKKPPVGTTLFWTDENGYGAYPIKIPTSLTCVDKFAVTLESTDDELFPAPTGALVLVSK